MTYANRLRLARQSVTLLSAPKHLHIQCLSPTSRRIGSVARTHFRALSSASDATPKQSRFANVPKEEEEHVSPWKQHRQMQLQEDQTSEDPMYEEAYPRIKSSPHRKSVPEFIEDFHDRLADDRVELAGRIRSKRVVGKNLIFVDLVNEFQKVQVMISKNKVGNEKQHRIQKFALLKNLIQVGDHISVVGVPTRTKAGELTLEARDLPELLSPAMEQIPEKLSDAKRRMQHRHVDMLVNKESIDVLRLRAEILKSMREHFTSKRFLEFQTPVLAHNAGGAVARPFVTKSTDVSGKNLALRIAPELWLKRLVVGGVDKVFEIGPAFRNEGIDATHNPEFTMCEFYSAYSNLPELINETEELLYRLAKRSEEVISTQLTSLPPIDLSRYARPFKQVEFVPALEAALGIRLPKLSSETALPELLAILKIARIHIPGEAPSTLPKLLDRLAAIYLEPMSFDQPMFITHHPECMSPLSKSFVCPQTYQLISARAELFVNGRELANMYEEENNPQEQKKKLASHRRLVNTLSGDVEEDPDEGAQAASEPTEADEESSPLDQSFVRALDYGLPPTGGWGCGVDRLVMLFSGANRISDCLSFGTLKNVVGLSTDQEYNPIQASEELPKKEDET